MPGSTKRTAKPKPWERGIAIFEGRRVVNDLSAALQETISKVETAVASARKTAFGDPESKELLEKWRPYEVVLSKKSKK